MAQFSKGSLEKQRISVNFVDNRDDENGIVKKGTAPLYFPP